MTEHDLFRLTTIFVIEFPEQFFKNQRFYVSKEKKGLNIFNLYKYRRDFVK